MSSTGTVGPHARVCGERWTGVAIGLRPDDQAGPVAATFARLSKRGKQPRHDPSQNDRPPALSMSSGGSPRMWGRWCHVLADVSAVRWLRERDRGWVALRRAGRTAIVMPAMFAVGDEVIGNPAVATFAAFGSFAMLLLVDFTGPMRARLAGAGGARGSRAACSSAWARSPRARRGSPRSRWRVVAFGVLFAGVVSSVLAGATTRCCWRSSCRCRSPGPASSIPERLAGWGLAAGASFAGDRAAVAGAGPRPAARRRDRRLPGAGRAVCA